MSRTKAVSQNQAGGNCYQPPTLPPKKQQQKKQNNFVCNAQHVSPDSASNSENGCKDPKRPAHEYMQEAQIIVDCRGFLSSLSFDPTRCVCESRHTPRGHSSSTITIAFPAETLTSLCLNLFIWAKARDGGADNY